MNFPRVFRSHIRRSIFAALLTAASLIFAMAVAGASQSNRGVCEEFRDSFPGENKLCIRLEVVNGRFAVSENESSFEPGPTFKQNYRPSISDPKTLEKLKKFLFGIVDAKLQQQNRLYYSLPGLEDEKKTDDCSKAEEDLKKLCALTAPWSELRNSFENPSLLFFSYLTKTFAGIHKTTSIDPSVCDE